MAVDEKGGNVYSEGMKILDRIRRLDMSVAYIFLADGFEEIEGLTVVDVLRRAGVDVRTVSIMRRLRIGGSHGIEVMADTLFESCDFSDGDLFVLPGGMPGTKYLRQHEGLCRLLQEKDAGQVRLAAICAAPSVLGELGLLKGRKAICYPGFEDRLEGAEVTFEKVVTDGHITTSMGMGTAIPFALRLTGELCGEAKAEEVKKSIRYGHLSDLQ